VFTRIPKNRFLKIVVEPEEIFRIPKEQYYISALNGKNGRKQKHMKRKRIPLAYKKVPHCLVVSILTCRRQ